MSRRQKITNILLAFINIISAVIMFCFPELGYVIVVAIMSIALLLYGIKLLIYYFVNARHMVSGKRVLYRGIVIFDLGAFTVLIADIPRVYLMIYLMGGIIFTGVIELLRAFEKKRFKAKYMFKLIQGVICITIGIMGIICSNTSDYIVYFYCLGMLYTAGIRIAEVLRKDIEIVAVAP